MVSFGRQTPGMVFLGDLATLVFSTKYSAMSRKE
jgi:hypothetical protein